MTWTVERHGEHTVIREGRAQVAAMNPHRHDYKESARLMASAPALLDALEEVLKVVNDARNDELVDAMTQAGEYLVGDVMTDATEAARAAIRAAKEEPSTTPYADRGRAAIAAGCPDNVGNNAREDLADTLTNIMHHATAAGLDFPEALARARSHKKEVPAP